MLFFTPRPGDKLAWTVRNNTDGSEDTLPIVVLERPTGGPRSTVRAVILRKTKAGETYPDVQSLPERFLEIRDEIVEALDGPAESPRTLQEIVNWVASEHKSFVEQQRANAMVALGD